MKKYLKKYLIIIIFSLFCTGCNMQNLQFIKVEIGEDSANEQMDITKYKNGAVVVTDTKKEKTDENNFEEENIEFGPEEIKFAN